MRDPSPGAAPTANILEGTYNQTYLIRTVDGAAERGAKCGSDDEDDDDFAERRVLFRCGNWCYTGNVTLDKAKVLLSDLPRIIPTLQRQQNRLHFYCNASNVPGESSFKEPLEFVGEGAAFAAGELSSERVHEELRSQRARNHALQASKIALKNRHKADVLDLARKIDSEKTATANAVQRVLDLQGRLQQLELRHGNLV